MSMTTTIHDNQWTAAYENPWKSLPVKLPTPLSDMDVRALPGFPLEEDAAVTPTTAASPEDGSDGASTRTLIVISGGCDSTSGNEFITTADFGSYFGCLSLSRKLYAFDASYYGGNNDSSGDGYWSGSVIKLADMPRERARHVGVVLRDQLCLYGGRDLVDAIVPEIDCYDPATNTWSTPSSLPSDSLRSDGLAFSLDSAAAVEDTTDVVLMLGGYSPSYTSLSSGTYLDFPDVVLDEVPLLAQSRGDVAGAISPDGSHIYVAGGYTHENGFCHPLSSVEVYDAHSLSSSILDYSLRHERAEAALVARRDGRLFVLGGEMQSPSQCELDDAFDGRGTTLVLDTVEVYDPSRHPPGPTDREDHTEHHTEQEDHAGHEEHQEHVEYVQHTQQEDHAGHEENGDYVQHAQHEGGKWDRLSARMPKPLFRFGALEWPTSDPLQREDNDHPAVIFAFGGQTSYDPTCDCFRTSDEIFIYQDQYHKGMPPLMEFGDHDIPHSSESTSGSDYNSGYEAISVETETTSSMTIVGIILASIAAFVAIACFFR